MEVSKRFNYAGSGPFTFNEDRTLCQILQTAIVGVHGTCHHEAASHGQCHGPEWAYLPDRYN